MEELQAFSIKKLQEIFFPVNLLLRISFYAGNTQCLFPFHYKQEFFCIYLHLKYTKTKLQHSRSVTVPE